MRVKDDDGYVLFHTPYTPGSFGPPGGVFKLRIPAQAALDRIGFREERRGTRQSVTYADLRGFVSSRRLGAFLRWFGDSADRESARDCLRREIFEELGEVGLPHLRTMVASLSFTLVRAVTEAPRTVPGRSYRQFRHIEVYELGRSAAEDRFRRALLRTARSGETPGVVLSTSSEIISGRCRAVLVGPQSAYLFGVRRVREDLPPAAAQ
ncbi:hypothetical protein O7610_20450 [Solwaraspora sp. WMMA2065]|nr:hypothetical protein [Solwaraspora sp. WMMA2065]WJK37850.1 hypothetical protein O7610_20450 [Solwaraspora sp. WMMA2065]